MYHIRDIATFLSTIESLFIVHLTTPERG